MQTETPKEIKEYVRWIITKKPIHADTLDLAHAVINLCEYIEELDAFIHRHINTQDAHRI